MRAPIAPRNRGLSARCRADSAAAIRSHTDTDLMVQGIRLHSVRLQESPRVQPAAVEGLSSRAREFLVGASHKDARGLMLLVWRVYEGLAAFDPAYLQEFRAEWRRRRLRHEPPNSEAQQPPSSDSNDQVVVPHDDLAEDRGSGDGPMDDIAGRHVELHPQSDQSRAEEALATSATAALRLPPWSADPVCLGIACIARADDEEEGDATPDGSEPTRLEDFAWRLERHWIVEWSDFSDFWSGIDDQSAESIARTAIKRARDRIPRPPVALLHEFGAILVGADLPERLRPALGAILAFHAVTADELRVAFNYIGLPVPSASELSRTLGYLESAGFIFIADEEKATRYRQLRALGRRPLRLYMSTAWELNRLAPDAAAGRKVPSSDWLDTSSHQVLSADGVPTDASLEILRQWSEMRSRLQWRGLSTL